jgi:hypothetical protein
VADINVERKAGPPIWIWIVGLLLLGLIIWAIASMTGRDDRQAVTVVDTTETAEMTTAPVQTTGAAMPAAAQRFMNDCHLDQGTRTDDMGREHEYTANCMEELANSIEAVAQQAAAGANVGGHVQTIRQNAQQIRESPATSTQHANWTREAALAGASALESVHQAAPAGATQAQSHVAQTRQAAERIQATDAQLDQKSEIRSYFRSAGDALQAMTGQTTRM